ncbi:hypothetical protein HASA104033_11550 [Halobacterium salinarum]|uniref:DUF1156 domain-containing protein n=2 Tax=Halobacterium salinarum TaxID=2242 RepID=A0A663A5Q7_HALS9|nr:hypothetical protein APQ99_02373 [Halobacterium salinarum DSM 3754]
MILKVMLEYAPQVDSLGSELRQWGEKVSDRAEENLEEYFPVGDGEKNIDSYVCTYTVECSSCGGNIPLVPKWWVKTTGTNVAVRPEVKEDGTLSFEALTDPNAEELEFNPGEGPVSRGGNVECLRCNVVTESEDVKERFKSGEFEYEALCVKYIDNRGKSQFRGPTKHDNEAFERAKKRVDADYKLSTLLDSQIPNGKETARTKRYGINEWRDLFSPRQLISHYELQQAVEHFKPEIRSEYDSETADALICLTTLAASKFIDRNSRLTDWDTSKGYPSQMLKGKNLSFKRVFTINNAFAGAMDFTAQLEKVADSYDKLVSYLPADIDAAEVTVGDAANLSYNDSELQAAIIDPPYYSSVMYSEFADIFYIWIKRYLNDTYPDLFESELTDKSSEAVANSSKFEDIADGSTSKAELARNEYEQKMSDIFSELYRVLEPGGVMTVMFTHKETDAWDTLTMSLINSGFTITSTHPITSEMPQRAGMRTSASADSTLLLTGRKPHEERDPENATPTLWSDVKADTRAAAKEAARDLLDSGLSLTKTDVIISAFGPTLRVFADAYPVVDDEDNDVPPRRALEEAREAVTQILVDEFLEVEGIDDLDDVTEWYVLCWLVHEKQTFAYDDGHQLGLGIGVDIDDIKRNTKTWRKSTGDISLRGHDDRVQNINEKPENRSSRTPVNPDDLSFGLALDKVHAAMHVYDAQGESACCDWLRERNFATDSTFKSTLKALLQVLPHDHEDWELARDLAVGRTRDVLDLEFSPNVFADDGDESSQQGLDDY